MTHLTSSGNPRLTVSERDRNPDNAGRPSIQELERRLERVTAVLRREEIDELIAFGSKTSHGTVRYLTGYEPWQTPEEWAFAVLTPSNGQLSLFSNSPWDFVDTVHGPTLLDVRLSNEWAAGLGSRLTRTDRRVGIAGWRSFPAPVLLQLQKDFPEADFVDVTTLVREVRAVKSPWEIAVLKQVGSIADLAGSILFERVYDGLTERELVSEIDAAMIKAGADEFAYPTNLRSGPTTARVCFRPTDHVVDAGDLVQLDCGPMVAGYRADYSRVIASPANKNASRLIRGVLSGYESALDMLQSGILCSEVARSVRDVFRKCGFSNRNFYGSINHRAGFFVGHGIGLENPDPPGLLSFDNHDRLAPGMVVNLEPLLIEERVGGARIEGAFVVQEGGPVPLSTSTVYPPGFDGGLQGR